MDNLISLVSEHLDKNKTLEDFMIDSETKNELMKFDYSKFSPKPDSYSRNRIFNNESFEILILAWDKDSKTPVHDHPENGCVLLLLDGSLVEERISEYTTIFSKVIPGKLSYIDNTHGKHSITAKKKSWSLHIYSPPFYYDKK